jgi:type I restriction enzyme S subunit
VRTPPPRPPSPRSGEGGDKKLPRYWRWTKVSDIAELHRGITYTKDVASDSEFNDSLPILRANNIGRYLNYEDLVYIPKKLIKPEQFIKAGDIIFAMSSGSKHLVGKSAVALKDFNGSYGAFCALLRINESVDRKYVSYVFRGNAYRKLISEIAKGTQINNLKREHLLDFQVPLPPLATQQAIVAKIEELFSELDKGIESIKLAQQLLKTYRQSVLWAGTSGMLTGTHKTYLNTITIGEPSARNANWQTVKLVEAAKLESGHTPRKDTPAYWKDGDVYWLSLQDIRALDGKIATDTKYKTNKLGIENSSARLLPIGTVCFCRDISVGYVTIMGKIMSTTQHFANWICGENLNNTFLMYCFMASRDSLIRQGQGTKLRCESDNINGPKLKEMRTPAPASRRAASHRRRHRKPAQRRRPTRDQALTKQARRRRSRRVCSKQRRCGSRC